MRFTTRGLNLMFSRNADMAEGKGMSRTSFIKVAAAMIDKSVWKTSAVPVRRLDIEEVIKYVAEYFNIKPETIKGTDRFRESVEPRMMVSLYCQKIGHTYESIGEKMGGKHHATIHHHVKSGKGLLKNNQLFSERYLDVEFMLNSKKIKPV